MRPMSWLAAANPGVPSGSASGTCSVYMVRTHSGRSPFQMMPASMKPREPVPVLCATLVPRGSCDGSPPLQLLPAKEVEAERAQRGCAAQRARDGGVRRALEDELQQEP